MKTLYFFILALFISSTAFNFAPQTSADDVLGIFWSPKKDGKIQIYKRGTKYYGKTIWSANPTKDVHNPNAALRTREVVGMEFLKDFVFDGDDEWTDGTVYDPTSGSTYNCKMWLEDGNLVLKGYIGVSILGRR